MISTARWSKFFLHTLRESPSDAEIASHKLMVRGGYITKVAPGIYTYGSLALRSIQKFEDIIREELDSRGLQEILMPMVHPAELWKETSRWQNMGKDLLKFKNRNDHEFCLGATHEEVITDYIRNSVQSYRDLPFILYQIQDKYRDEIRPRFGLMRGREFLMKDAYSFDVDEKAALKSYEVLYEAYRAIFQRLNLEFRVVEADAGAIGGSKTHEFQVLAGAGEDHLMVCSSCDFAANIEIAPVNEDKLSGSSATPPPMETFATPGLRTIDDLAQSLNMAPEHLVKTLFYSAAPEGSKDIKPVAVLLRGSDELNPVKLKNLLGLPNPPLMLTDEEVKQVTGASPGSCGPQGLDVPIYADQSLKTHTDMIAGANKDDFHVRHLHPGRDFKVTAYGDLRMAKAGDTCPRCNKGTYQSYRGIEVGHIFYLGTKYSDSMKATYLDQNGKSQLIHMGCYGIGVTRTVQAAIEQNHDEDGIKWPEPLAPFQVHVALLDPGDEGLEKWLTGFTKDMNSAGKDVFIDDRKERPGVKFKDADLLGFPWRVNAGKRGFDNGEVEVFCRATKEKRVFKPEEAAKGILAWSQETIRN